MTVIKNTWLKDDNEINTYETQLDLNSSDITEQIEKQVKTQINEYVQNLKLPEMVKLCESLLVNFPQKLSDGVI